MDKDYKLQRQNLIEVIGRRLDFFASVVMRKNICLHHFKGSIRVVVVISYHQMCAVKHVKSQ